MYVCMYACMCVCMCVRMYARVEYCRGGKWSRGWWRLVGERAGYDVSGVMIHPTLLVGVCACCFRFSWSVPYCTCYLLYWYRVCLPGRTPVIQEVVKEAILTLTPIPV